MASDSRIARGMFRFGFLISSPACEIISYPSNAMNVNPIASAIPVIPSGIKSVKFSDQFGFANAIAPTAAATSTPIIASCVNVIAFPTLPVSDDPLILTNVKMIIAIAANSLSIGNPKSSPMTPDACRR